MSAAAAYAAGLLAAADHITQFCPEHGTDEDARMECACDIAEEIRELADVLPAPTEKKEITA